MNEPDISPLAKRLAEENNVRWQELKGSGAGGKVVERDVLEYLARVMAGEEALDPTPEPLPEGMEAWPEEDVAAYRRGIVGELVDDDAADAEERRPPTHEDLDVGGYDDGDDTGLISEDIFLFDEAETDDGSDEIVSHEGHEEDVLLIAGDDTLAAESGGFDHDAGPAAEFDEIEDLDLTESADVEDDDTALFAASDVAPVDDDVELFVGRDDDSGFEPHDDAGEEPPHPVAAVDRSADDRGTGRGDELAGQSFRLEVPEEDLDLDVDALDDDLFGAGHGATADGDIADGLTTAARTGAEANDLDLADGDAYDVGEIEGTSHVDTSHDDTSFDDALHDDTSYEGTSHDDTSYDDAPHDDASYDDAPHDHEVAARFDGSAFDDLAGPGQLAAAADLDMGVEDDGSAHEATEAGDDVVAPEAVGIADLPLVSHGILLRRHIDLTSLAAAQLAVGREIDQGDPIAPTSFLVRAAAKAQDRVPLGEGHVGVANFAGGFGIYAVEDASTMPYAELWRAMGGSEEQGDDVGGLALVVADMSELDVDEAVLHLGVPVLTLGRILYDNHQGSYRSTLSLAGDIAPDQGARFLARVAELLDAPVQLVL